jgi:hypothetical protein
MGGCEVIRYRDSLGISEGKSRKSNTVLVIDYVLDTVLVEADGDRTPDGEKVRFITSFKMWMGGLRKFLWYAERRKSGEYRIYARVQRGSRLLRIYLHRWVANPESHLEVDHVDRNPLNNHPSNLRPATRSENELNKSSRSGAQSGLRGVSRKGKAWEADVRCRGMRYRKIFPSETAAGSWAATVRKHLTANRGPKGPYGRADVGRRNE